MKIELISTYELGVQPMNLALPAAFLGAAGHAVACTDTSLSPLPAKRIKEAEMVAVSTPMHTALHLGLQLITRIRAINPDVHLCFYGLYAGLHAEHLFEQGVDSVAAGEYEQELLKIIDTITAQNRDAAQKIESTSYARQQFIKPDRSTLLPLSRYAHVITESGCVTAGYTQSSRGCAHRCLHCPITPAYAGRFRIVQKEIVLADIAQQVEAGARHITFGDPDFLNSAKHAVAIIREMHNRWPELTFDFTARVEHLLQHKEILPELAACGCLFIISAIETLNDDILHILDKGHSKEDIFAAVTLVKDAGITLRPTLLPFTPWTKYEDLIMISDFTEDFDLSASIDAVQFSVRLLLPPDSSLLPFCNENGIKLMFDEKRFTFNWQHKEPEMDALQQRIEALAAREALRKTSPHQVFPMIKQAIYKAAGKDMPLRGTPHASSIAPGLSESWFC